MFDRVAYMRGYNAAYRKKHAKKLAEAKRLWIAKDRKRFPEKYVLKKRRYRELNADSYAETTARYLARNKDRIRAAAKRRYELKRDEILAKGRAYNRKNRNKKQEYQRNRRRAEPGFRLRDSLRHRIWAALKGASKLESTEDLIGCSVASLQSYLQEKFRSGMTWENYGPVWHVDHIKPCAKFDLTNLREQQRCFHWSNLQPLFKEENQRKGDRPWK